MIRKELNHVRIVFMVVLLLPPILLKAQDRKDKSYPDINIMNGILKELMKDAYKENYGTSDVSGSYLPNYGLLFVVNPPAGAMFMRLPSEASFLKSRLNVFELLDSSAWRNGLFKPKIDSLTKALTTENLKKAESFKDFTEKLDKAVFTFLETYADATNKLLSSQQISVIVFIDEDSPIQARVYKVSRQYVADYRMETLSDGNFKQKVMIDDVKEGDEDASVDIMAAIFEKAISDGLSGEDRVMPTAGVRGVYLKSFGAFFVCNVMSLQYFDYTGNTTDSHKDSISRLKKLIIQIMADYGTSLKFLQNDQSISALLHLASFDRRGGDVLISLKKQDIILYSRSEISYDTLQQRATIIEN